MPCSFWCSYGRPCAMERIAAIVCALWVANIGYSASPWSSMRRALARYDTSVFGLRVNTG